LSDIVVAVQPSDQQQGAPLLERFGECGFGWLHWIFGAAFTGAIGIYVAVRSPRALISRSLATLLANYFASAS